MFWHLSFWVLVTNRDACLSSFKVIGKRFSLHPKTQDGDIHSRSLTDFFKFGENVDKNI
jgi:hypothetical protein